MRTPLSRISCLIVLFVGSVRGSTFSFSTGSPNGPIATASRPAGATIAIETADDFILAAPTTISQVTFTGLLPSGTQLSSLAEVVVEIYRVFPLDSNNPPSGSVPTRSNSPSDGVFALRDSVSAGLSFNSTLLNPTFTAGNSVVNGINKIPNQLTGGEGPVTGEEVVVTATLTPALYLPAGHYFVVPQVLLSSSNSNFLWLSAARPAFTGDLQNWIRNANLDPDWLRIGTDVIGGTTFNSSFSLTGFTSPRGDFNFDGKADILLRDAGGNLGMWMMNGVTIAGAAFVGSPGGSYTVAGTGDFNGDGRNDILLRDNLGDLGMWLMNGSTIVSGAFVGSPGGSYSVAAIADFDGDGKADILLRDNVGTLGMWIMNGPVIMSGAFVGSPGGSYTVAGVGDLDGDGRADILLRDNLGNLGVWMMNGSTIASGAFVGSPGGSYTVAGVADFNGDNKADILLRDNLGNLGMWIMNGSTTTSGAYAGSPGGSYTVSVTNDYDGDGKADILLRDDFGNLRMWIMSGSVINTDALVDSPGAGYVEY